MFIRPGGFTVDSSFPVLIIPGSGANPIAFSNSRRVDEEIWRRLFGREGRIEWLEERNLRRNAIVLFYRFVDPRTGFYGGSSIMVLDRVIFAERVVRVQG
jgi:hypothetical protein